MCADHDRHVPNQPSYSRRHWLQRCSSGFGLVAAASLLDADRREVQARDSSQDAWTLPQQKAKHVILCYMSGGVSHVDSFDPKPKLNELHGQSMPVAIERTQFNQNGQIFGSPFSFKRHGESGLQISELFPEIATCADHLAVVRSMTTSVNEHAQGNFVMHSGFPFLGHPSAGAWVSYGLGSANENLPAYVVLRSGNAVEPHGGVGLFSNGFLPGQHQASILTADAEAAVANVRPIQLPGLQKRRLTFIDEIDSRFAAHLNDTQVDAAIKNYETAFRMQTAVPSLCDLSDESQETLRMYGVDDTSRQKSAYARQALLARRLVERGVRFIELSVLTQGIGAGGAANPWDQHGDLERGHRAMANQVDQPIAALIKDLDQRGLLDATLIVFTGEFGRTPFSQGTNGRDHNPMGFSLWMAGGGMKGGTVLGATDELGYRAVESPCTVYDIWATVLHQLGIDHQAFTFRSGGRDFRLTDVHGNVLHELLA